MSLRAWFGDSSRPTFGARPAFHEELSVGFRSIVGVEMVLANEVLAEVAGGLVVLGDGASDVELTERIRLLEVLKNAASAAQARAAVALTR